MVFGDCVHDKYMTTGIYELNGGGGGGGSVIQNIDSVLLPTRSNCKMHWLLVITKLTEAARFMYIGGEHWHTKEMVH